MENRDLLKLAFEAGKEYGSNRTDKNFNDFLDKHKEQLALCNVVGRSEQLKCDCCKGTGMVEGEHYDDLQSCNTCLGKGTF